MIPTATTSASGLMSAAIYNQHVTNTAKVSNATHTGDVTDAAGVLTVKKINGVLMQGLATGIVKNTTGTGAPSIAIASDFPTLNQSTTGTANKAYSLTGGGIGSIPYQSAENITAMLSAGTAGHVLKCNGSAAPSWAPINIEGGGELSGILPVTLGGTGAATLTGIVKGNGDSPFTTVIAPTGDIVGTTDVQTLTNKTLGTGTTVTTLGTPTSGNLTNCTGLPIVGGTSGTLSVARGGSGAVTLTGILKGNGTSAFTAITAPTGDIVGTTDTQTLTNKTFGSGTTISAIGTPTTGTLTNCTGLPIGGGTTGTLPVNRGGTGAAILSGILIGNGTNAFTTVAAPAGTIVGTTDTQTLTNKTLGSGTVFSTGISATNGGTGQSSYTIGDILFADTVSSLSKLVDVATGNALISGGIGVAPSYGKVGLTTHVSGTLPVANGGTGVTAASTGTGGVVLSTSPTLVTPILGTPTSGTLTSCTGLPISGLVGSTSTALGVGSIELGHATDTTISRVSAGRIAVEGINVVTASSTDTLTNKTLVAPALGTPTSGTLTSCTGLPLTTGVTGILPVANGGTGVTQSAYGECYISSVTATTITTAGTFVKVAGTTTAGTLSNFTHPDTNRLTYTGTATRKFLITTALSFHGTGTNDYKFALYKNTSSALSASIISSTGAGTGDLAHISCQTIVELATNDFIEVFVTNADATNSATIDFMNVVAVAII